MRLRFLLPRYWPTWLGLGLLRALALVPFRAQMRICATLGSVGRRFLPRHVRVARRNLALCLPEASAAEREQILREHFRSLGMTLGETAYTWFRAHRLPRLAQVHGLEHLDGALAAGNGAILLAAHFTTTEIAAGIMAATRPTQVVYKPTKDPLLAEILAKRRSAVTRGAIARDDIRSMIRTLRANGVVWYAPDQAYRHKGAEMVPFFGLPAATNTATSRLARVTGAKVLPYLVERLPQAQGYRVTIHPPFDCFPSDDSVADTRRYHQLLEAHVRLVPEQYLWVHRRFKGLDSEYPDYYG